MPRIVPKVGLGSFGHFFLFSGPGPLNRGLRSGSPGNAFPVPSCGRSALLSGKVLPSKSLRDVPSRYCTAGNQAFFWCWFRFESCLGEGLWPRVLSRVELSVRKCLRLRLRLIFGPFVEDLLRAARVRRPRILVCETLPARPLRGEDRRSVDRSAWRYLPAPWAPLWRLRLARTGSGQRSGRFFRTSRCSL